MNEQRITIKGLTDEKINYEFRKLEKLQIDSTDGSTFIPLTIILDLSGSMNPYYSTVKKIIGKMNEFLALIQSRNFTLTIISVWNSKARVMYFGALKDFSYEEFLKALPEKCAGKTPLADAYDKAKQILESVESAYKSNKAKKFNYTIPVVFSVTDSAATDDENFKSKVSEYCKNKIMENDMLLVEFVTDSNPDGLNLGGYKVPIDGENTDDVIAEFFTILTFASTAVQSDESIYIPDKTNRFEYNRYRSDVFLINFKFAFEKLMSKD